jgi:hypothetical protein
VPAPENAVADTCSPGIEDFPLAFSPKNERVQRVPFAIFLELVNVAQNAPGDEKAK